MSQQVRPFERIVGQLEGLVPPSFPTQRTRVVHAEYDILSGGWFGRKGRWRSTRPRFQ
jgi:hypothetical protein